MTYYCTDCDKLFYAGRKARDQHCQATGHASPAFECDSCSDCFEDEYDRRQHMNLEQHWRRNAPQCQLCGDRAVTQAEIREHEIERHFHCADCNRLSHHLERGSCPRVPMDRNKLYRYIKNRDHRSLITNKELAWYGDKTYAINPTAAWNPWSKAFECYLCHKLHMTLTGLKKHLESPRHQQ
ncbi:zinc finger protein, partial [Fusarium circinatum]